MQCLTNQENRQIFKSHLSVHSVFSVTECMKFLGPKILRHKLKQLEKFKEFRKAIKQWKAAICPFRLCKIYIHRLGFI